MTLFSRNPQRSRWYWTIGLWVGLIVTAGIAVMTSGRWWAGAQQWVQQVLNSDAGADGTVDTESADGQLDHGTDDGANSLQLSAQAMGNIGLTTEFLKPVTLESFVRAITVPAIVVERPGRTRLEVGTPMAGIITHVHAVQGEAVEPGSLLFEIRITAEELVDTQTGLLKTMGDLAIENREIARLEVATRSRAVPEKTLIERQYAKDKLEVLLATQKEALRLHGLSERQIFEITENRRLLRDLRIVAPEPDDHSHEELRLTDAAVIPIAYTSAVDGLAAMTDRTPLILQDVLVHKGEIVAAGATLAVVADLTELHIEGRAFEQDVDLLMTATTKKWRVTADFERGGQQVESISELELLYSASDVDVESRTLRFYVRLPNQIVRDVPSPNGQRYVEWKYRTGQRLQLRVPVEQWNRQIVLPVDAISQEGAEAFVFQQNGVKFDRVAVSVAYRDQTHVVIKNDGSIFPGDVVAWRGAHQLQMTLKNKSGVGVDPHAGHNH